MTRFTLILVLIIFSIRMLSQNSTIIEHPRIDLAKITKVSKKDSLLLDKIFNQLLNALKTTDTQTINNLSLEKLQWSYYSKPRKIEYIDKIMARDDFASFYLENVYNSMPTQNDGKVKYTLYRVNYLDLRPTTFALKKSKKLITYNLNFTNITAAEPKNVEGKYYHSFDFVQVNGDFKFYSLSLIYY